MQNTNRNIPALSGVMLLALLGACSGKKEQAASVTEAAAAATAPASDASPETREPNSKPYGYKPAFEGQTRAPGIKTSQAIDVQVVAEGLEGPWAFEFLPDGRILFTERSGNLRILEKDGKKSEPAKGLPAVLFEGQGGLLDVALDPQYATNKTIYWSYSEPRKGGNGTALAKGVLVEDAPGLRVEKVKVIFQQMPTIDSKAHFGSRIVFTPDGKQLYLVLGERAIPEGRVQAQDLGSLLGKVVRLNLDGSVPKDNPFVGTAGARPEIFSYGHRSMQAATIDTATGKFWTIEHGPRGGDELNHPEAGKNYGWPTITYGIDYPGTEVTPGVKQQQDGMEQPVYYWDPVIAPSGMIVYEGDLFPEWKGSILVGGLSSMKLVRLKLADDKVVGEEWLLQDRQARIRDVQQAADGSVYVIADGANASLLRLAPKT